MTPGHCSNHSEFIPLTPTSINLGGYCPQYASHPVGLAGFEPATPCPPVKCRLFVSVRSCSEIAPIRDCEHQRTQANISGRCFSGGTSGGTCWTGPALFESDLNPENTVPPQKGKVNTVSLCVSQCVRLCQQNCVSFCLSFCVS